LQASRLTDGATFPSGYAEHLSRQLVRLTESAADINKIVAHWAAFHPKPTVRTGSQLVLDYLQTLTLAIKQLTFLLRETPPRTHSPAIPPSLDLLAHEVATLVQNTDNLADHLRAIQADEGLNPISLVCLDDCQRDVAIDEARASFCNKAIPDMRATFQSSAAVQGILDSFQAFLSLLPTARVAIIHKIADLQSRAFEITLTDLAGRIPVHGNLDTKKGRELSLPAPPLSPS
jgi:hypothetical protein